MSPLEGDQKTSPPVVALLVGGRQVLSSPGRWAWDIPGASARLYLEQSDSQVGKGKAGSGDMLGHLSSISFGTGVRGATAIEEGSFPMITQSGLTEPRLCVPAGTSTQL